ncbi:CCA tRNA nucleotidyltransferase [Alkalihalobacillus sp. BA299]|uniref:CCA tRNA nucleotidyltransferase n=1 Tax=Alkalihalobacillus sp. BA299 TaxID=2815938 RepID=UPI001ADBAA44|nr:CCA tRNA nucleotidyltransferase [Alkalihalobacillus sp. BA299]
MEPAFVIGSKIIGKLKQAGYEAYFVGGAVRDVLLHRPIHDVDITTSASVEIIEHLFKTTVPLGRDHGTVVVCLEDHSFEVTTYRSGHEKAISLLDDLQKRDFTMNAIAMTEDWTVVDPFHFRSDLDRKLICAVGNGMDRFTEDPLRMLRACRFSSQLNFQIETNTLQSIVQCRGQIENVAVERIVSEFEKLLTATFFTLGLNYLLKTGLASYISIFENKEEVLKNLVALKLDRLQSVEEVWTAFLFVDRNESDHMMFLKCLRKSKKILAYVHLLYIGLKRYKTEGFSNKLIYDLGLDNSLKLRRLIYVLIHSDPLHSEQELYSRYAELPIKSRHDLKINGHTLIQVFHKKQGPWINELLEKVEQAVLALEVQNDHREILAWLNEREGFK